MNVFNGIIEYGAVNWCWSVNGFLMFCFRLLSKVMVSDELFWRGYCKVLWVVWLFQRKSCVPVSSNFFPMIEG